MLLHCLGSVDFKYLQNIFKHGFCAKAKLQAGVHQPLIVAAHPAGIVELVEKCGELDGILCYLGRIEGRRCLGYLSG